ncbi:hypothetical protein [uncultured Bartonella sp.]|nr:hypothetical protein [uncultured Bartonella sp.]
MSPRLWIAERVPSLNNMDFLQRIIALLTFNATPQKWLEKTWAKP